MTVRLFLRMATLTIRHSLKRGQRFSAHLSTRSFSTTLNRDTDYGFIGLGAMGYPMAGNLRSKISASDSFIIFDQNRQALSNFQKEHDQHAVQVATSSREVAEKSVSTRTVFANHFLHSSDEHVPDQNEF